LNRLRKCSEVHCTGNRTDRILNKLDKLDKLDKSLVNDPLFLYEMAKVGHIVMSELSSISLERDTNTSREVFLSIKKKKSPESPPAEVKNFRYFR